MRISVDSDKFFGNVIDADDIFSIFFHSCNKAFVAFNNFDTESCKYGNKRLFRHFASKDLLKFFCGELNFSHLLIIDFDICQTFNDIARTCLIYECKCTLDAVFLRCKIDALFKTCGTIRTQVECARCSSDIVACKFCRFENDFDCIFFYSAVCTAHNAGNCNRFICIANDKHTLVEFILFAVKRNYVLVIRCVAHNYFVSVKFALVKRVHWLSDLGKNIVGDINDVVYRANSDCSQSRFNLL